MPTGGGVAIVLNRFPSVNQAITEVWRSDGTAAGTLLVDTVGNYAPVASATEAARTLVDGRLLFRFGDGVNGDEPWSSQVVSSTPTAVTLSNTFILENSLPGTAVGTLDSIGGSGIVFTLVPGVGSGDNGLFTVDGTTLRANITFNYETRFLYSVRVRATGSSGAFLEQDFTITVLSENEAPVARPDQVVVGQDATTFATLDVLANDFDPDGEIVLTIDSFTQGSHGTVILQPGSKLGYRPQAGFTGSDQFSYTIRDFEGLLATTTVSVSVTSNTVVVDPQPGTFQNDLQSAIFTAGAEPVPSQVVVNVDSTNVANVVDVIRDMISLTPVTIVLSVNTGTYHGITVAAPPNLRVVLNGLNGQVTLVGASPALVVESGIVEVQNGVVFTNSTDFPTILVTHGTLILRDSRIEETTGGNQAAIQVSGDGVVDLGTAADPGGNTLVTRGAGLLVRNETSFAVTAIGNAYLADETPLGPTDLQPRLGGNVLVALPPSATVESVVINGSQPATTLPQRSLVKDLTVTFSGLVNIATGAFEVFKLGAGGGAAGVSFTSSNLGGKTVAIVTFPGALAEFGSLTDGNYELTIRADLVHTADEFQQKLDGDGNGIAGGDHHFGDEAVDKFFRLFGDSDGDRDVDNLDNARFRGTYLKTVGNAAYLWFLNFDGDQDVDTADNAKFGERYGKKMLFPVAT